MAYCKVETNDGYTIVSNVLLRDERLTLKAKGLLSLILSLPPKWDMTIEGLSKICIECSDTISGILKELEAAGYLSRYRERLENGRYAQMIYHFFSTPSHKRPIPKKPKRKKPVPEKPIREKSGQLSKEAINKEETNKDCSDILSINQDDAMDEMRIYRTIVCENIDYEYLIERNNNGMVDEIVEIMLECICSTAQSIVIGKETLPKELVKSRFLKLDSSHIEYVLYSLNNNGYSGPPVHLSRKFRAP